MKQKRKYKSRSKWHRQTINGEQHHQKRPRLINCGSRDAQMRADIKPIFIPIIVSSHRCDLIAEQAPPTAVYSFNTFFVLDFKSNTRSVWSQNIHRASPCTVPKDGVFSESSASTTSTLYIHTSTTFTPLCITDIDRNGRLQHREIERTWKCKRRGYRGFRVKHRE